MLYRWLEENGRELSALTESDLMEWMISMRQRSANAHTINHRLHTCRLFYRFVVGRELIARSPLVSRGRGPGGHIVHPQLGVMWTRRGPSGRALRVKPEHRLIEPLSNTQVNLFIEALDRYRDLTIVLLMLFGGLRTQETLSLRMADIDFTAARIRVRGKGNRERALPFPDQIAMPLRKYLHLERPPESPSDRVFLVLQGARRGLPMTVAGIRSVFRARRRAHNELKPANPHRFRHTFGAEMARSGVRLPVLQRMMGHVSGLTTLRYILLSATDVAAEYHRAMERISQRYETGL
jgi:site-specific recombinase XerD